MHMLHIDFRFSFSAAAVQLKYGQGRVDFHNADATTPYWRAPDIAGSPAQCDYPNVKFCPR